MSIQDSNRARRQVVAWPARVRAKGQDEWHDGRVLNLSVTGALLQIDHRYPLGELVEVEIDFLNRRDSQVVVAGNGYVVREHRPIPNSSAVHFELGCSIARRRASEKSSHAITFSDWSTSTRGQDFANLARLA